jgi:hypothetical protein
MQARLADQAHLLHASSNDDLATVSAVSRAEAAKHEAAALHQLHDDVERLFELATLVLGFKPHLDRIINEFRDLYDARISRNRWADELRSQPGTASWIPCAIFTGTFDTRPPMIRVGTLTNARILVHEEGTVTWAIGRV